MRKLFYIVCAVATISTVGTLNAASVDGYYRQDGTYVQPHQRTNPNGSLSDNYSTQGNTNPYTGQAGTRDPYGSSSNSYGSGSNSYGGSSSNSNNNSGWGGLGRSR